jgi:hypothetical protein
MEPKGEAGQERRGRNEGARPASGASALSPVARHRDFQGEVVWVRGHPKDLEPPLHSPTSSPANGGIPALPNATLALSGSRWHDGEVCVQDEGVRS